MWKALGEVLLEQPYCTLPDAAAAPQQRWKGLLHTQAPPARTSGSAGKKGACV